MLIDETVVSWMGFMRQLGAFDSAWGPKKLSARPRNFPYLPRH